MKSKKTNHIKSTDGIKYFNSTQIKLLLQTVQDRSEKDMEHNRVTAIREFMAIDLIVNTGLRVSEASDVRCGDLKINNGDCALFVRNGKGNRSRTIQISDSLKKHLLQYLQWKRQKNESTDKDAHLFVGQRGPLGSQGIQWICRKYLKALNLYETGKCVHSLRHSYATELYRQRRCLRTVQKQLGHRSIATTQIYADVTPGEVREQLEGLWN